MNIMNRIAAMSDVEFALAFTAASVAWMGLVWLAHWLIEQAINTTRARRNTRPASPPTIGATP